MKKSLGVVFALLFLLCAGLYAEEQWNLVKSAEDIKVFMRPVAGTDGDEFQGIADIKAPYEVPQEVFKDIPSFPQWFGFCLEAKQLKHETEDHWLLYIVIETMGPVKDRDLVVDVNRVHGPEKTVVTMKALTDEIVPRQSKYVRMTKLEGSVIFTKIDEDTTHVVYTVKSSPGGYIPKWLSNLIQKDQPFLTLKGLREMSQKDVYYQKAGIARKK